MSSTDASPKASRLGHGTMDVRVSLGHTVQNAAAHFKGEAMGPLTTIGLPVALGIIMFGLGLIAHAPPTSRGSRSIRRR